MSAAVQFHRVYVPYRWDHIASPATRERLEEGSRGQVGKWIVSIGLKGEVARFFGATLTRRAVVDDFGNLVRVK